MRRICNFCNIPFTIANQVQKLMGLDVRQDKEGDFYEVSHFKIKITKTETKKESATNRAFWSKTLNESKI
jgi:alpha-galactosidase/6-phospho-beta-glucosidase family protein